MSRKIYVPFMNSNIHEENIHQYVEILKEAEATTVFIAIDRYIFFTDDRKEFLEKLKIKKCYFEEQGFQTGIWIQAFGFGDALSEQAVRASAQYTKIRSISGREAGDAFCPANPYFVKDYCSLVSDIASIHPELIMLDDDLCLSVRPGLGCFCDAHIRMLNEEIGEKLPLEEWKQRIFTEGASPYRSAYLKVMGNSLKGFCKTVREAVDQVDPEIRVGVCAGYTSWDIEGADTVELAEILAGNTKPFLRYTGAPYWVAKDIVRFPGQRLGSVIECVRAQEKWCRLKNIETFNEADSYPRPRWHVPASYLECYDMALSASSSMGTLKYIGDYYSEPDYETGYLKHHKKNQKIYKFINENFNGKNNLGIYAVEEQRKFENMKFNNDINEYNIMFSFFSPAAAMLSSLSIPTTYDENDDCAIVFGDNAKYINKYPRKLILDARAAQILQEKGIDTGIISMQPAGSPRFEYTENNKINLHYNMKGDYYKCKLNQNAEAISWFETHAGDRYPATIRSENNNIKFLIFTFDAYSEIQNHDVFRSYLRQKQILDFAGDMPHICGETDVYIIFKKENDETAILLENLSEDIIFDFEIALDDCYSAMEICGADGELLENKIIINTDFTPYTAIAIHLRK